MTDKPKRSHRRMATRAYTEGKEAAMFDRPITDNPYPPSSDPNSDYRQWNRGHTFYEEDTDG